MTRSEIRAFNQGVEAVLAIAEASAKSLADSALHPTRRDFALSALLGLAEAGKDLLIESGPNAPLEMP